MLSVDSKITTSTCRWPSSQVKVKFCLLHERLERLGGLSWHRRNWDLLHIHSFIHYKDLYSAPSRLLLRSAPDPCTAKKKSFEARLECVRRNPGSNRCARGSPFHTEGPTTENARAWDVEVGYERHIKGYYDLEETIKVQKSGAVKSSSTNDNNVYKLVMNADFKTAITLTQRHHLQ